MKQTNNINQIYHFVYLLDDELIRLNRDVNRLRKISNYLCCFAFLLKRQLDNKIHQYNVRYFDLYGHYPYTIL